MDYRDYQAGAGQDYFWFKAKRKLVEVLLRKLDGGGRLRILNVGAGVGDDVPMIAQFGEVSVLDSDAGSLELISSRLVADKKLGDVCRLEYADGSFDVVLALDVLEHVENDRLALSEIHRVLKRGGMFIFTVPAIAGLFSAHDRALSHFRRYDKVALEHLLKDFSRVEIGYWVFSLFLPVAAVRLLRRNSAGAGVDHVRLPRPVNAALYALLSAENWLIRRGVSLPVGTSLYGMYRKPIEQLTGAGLPN